MKYLQKNEHHDTVDSENDEQLKKLILMNEELVVILDSNDEMVGGIEMTDT